jgi:hypothetical protein
MWRENGFRVMQVDAWKEPAPVHHLTQEKLESLNKAELMFLIEHERQHRKMGADTSGWRDTLRDHVDKTAKEHNTSEWMQTGKGTSPNATPIPMLDTPNFDLGDDEAE